MAIKREKNKKIKVAFPHMGTISIAWAAGLRKIGVEPFVPPYTGQKTHRKLFVCLINLFSAILLKQLKAELIMLQ